jgi:hypothetical protein
VVYKIRGTNYESAKTAAITVFPEPGDDPGEPGGEDPGLEEPGDSSSLWSKLITLA